MFKKKKPIIISESNPLSIGKLKVYPDKLEYKDIRCNFIDIEHIGWYWLSQTINLLNTQEVRLTIYIRGSSKKISTNKTTMYVTPKIVTAYNYIAKETFQNRLRFYTDQLEAAGGFVYDNCKIYSDGRVVSNSKTFSLSKADIEAFTITIKQGGLFSPKVKIDLTLDRDVILPLIDFILKNPQDPSVYIENHKQQKKAEESYSIFLRDIVSLMAKLSGADDYVSPEEIAIVKDFLINTIQLNKEKLSQATAVFNHAKTSLDPFEYFAESLSKRFKHDKNMLLSILDLLFSIAIADGVLSAEEELLLLEAESIFGVKGSAYNQFKQQANYNTTSDEEYYLNILGRSIGATQEEIKGEYRRLVMKFHPDRVHHLGEEFVREAETKIKQINEAYEYLRNR
jgi:DnaJ like chaperone protein